MGPTKLLIFHLFVSISFMYATLRYSYLMVLLPERYYEDFEIFRVGRDGGFYIICIWLTIIYHVYFGMNSWISISEYLKKGKSFEKWHKTASFLLFAIIFPFSAVVSAMFWSVYFYDREGIYPVVIDEVAPFWIHHFCHTIPAPMALVYMATTNQVLPSKKETFNYMTTFLVIYSLLFLQFRWTNDKWIYLFLNNMSDFKAFLVVSLWFFSHFFFFFLGYELNSILNYLKGIFIKLGKQEVKNNLPKNMKVLKYY